MTVFILMCYYDSSTEICGVFDSLTKANNEAKRMEQIHEVDVGCWSVKSEKVQ